MKSSIALVGVVLLAAACRAPLPASEAPVADGLPLARGYFVTDGTPCEGASNATVSLHTGRGINGARASCEFTRIERTGDDTYVVDETCTHLRGWEESRELRFTIRDRTSYSAHDITNDARFSARHCPQASLPEPWRSNDLSDIAK